jgi:hypothetical protein
LESWVWRALRVPFVLLFLLAVPMAVRGQTLLAEASGTERSLGFRIGQNYPNPFSDRTRIPVELSDDLFATGGGAVVSMRIYNVFREFVATPVALGHTSGSGIPVEELAYLSAGRHEAEWDGRNRNGDPVPTGVYLLEVTVNGRAQVLKMVVRRS